MALVQRIRHLNENYVVAINNPDNLSDGELHNIIVAKLLKNINKYVSTDGNLNFKLLLEDAIEYEKELYPEGDYTVEFKNIWLPKAVEQTTRIVNSSALLFNANNDEFLEDVYAHLIPEIKISKVEFDNANILIKKSCSTYMMLDEENIKKYSTDIDNVIDNTTFNQELKSDLKSSNNVLMNSTLIWKEVK